MNSEDFEQQMNEEMQEVQFEQAEDQEDERAMSQGELSELYGAPEPEQRFNQHTFLANSLVLDEPEKVTFMSEGELGRPLFSLRFLLDIEDISGYYIDNMAKELGLTNEIKEYFRQKIKNLSDSGMSNKGFVQNLNVTRRMDATRERIKNLQPVNMKGGNRIRT